MNASPMLNAYPDSLGGTLGDLTKFLDLTQVKGAFSSIYLLPSVFHSDLDRGFSVIDYQLDRMLANSEDLNRLRDRGLRLKLDMILNHASVLSPQFQSLLAMGDRSPYRDFFIEWNQFWAGRGTMTPDGYIQPDSDAIQSMFFRKPGLPFLMVRFPDGKEHPYWNTFYQEIRYCIPETAELMRIARLQYGEACLLRNTIQSALSEGLKPRDIDFGTFSDCKEAVIEWMETRRMYLGQMDLNIKSRAVWEYYRDTLKTLADYGAEIVRLDAFAYASKKPGARNFLNDPETWDLLQKVNQIAAPLTVTLLPEIHARYSDGIHRTIAQQGYPSYDFFLPGLVLDAIERKTSVVLLRWAHEMYEQKIRTINMLGCHDGIPLLDLQGLLSDDQIQNLIRTVVGRGGHVKDLHGQKNAYYQVNATYFSALGEDPRKLLLARVIQLFMPGKPQIWYLDLFAGKNDLAAVERSGPGGHKEINRTNLSWDEVRTGLSEQVVEKQLSLIRFRNECSAFGYDAQLEVFPGDGRELKLRWGNAGSFAMLEADLERLSYTIQARNATGQTWFFES